MSDRFSSSYRETFVALRRDLIENLKTCWAGAPGVDNGTLDQLAISISIVLLELSPDTGAEATTAIFADAKSIARDVLSESTRGARI